MGLFGKKTPSRDELISQGAAEAEAQAAAADNEKKDEVTTGNEKVDIELTKIYAQLDSFAEIRKANSERFTRISEQLGEIRGMIVDTNKAMSKIEVAATKATDLVESVHPEKLMIEVRKQDGKVEALRANIESSEAIIKDLMAELKKMREQMNFYKGIEQVAKLNDEVKQELASVKKMEAVIERHADKVETIFVEVEKKFSTFDKFDSITKDVQSEMKKLSSDFDKTKVKLETKEDKKEFVTLVDKFNNFETHTTNLLKLLDERSKTLKEGLERDFKKLKKKIEHKLKVGEVDLDAPDEPQAKPRSATPAQAGEPEVDDSGSDVAGGDTKQGFFSKIKHKIIKQPIDGDAAGEAPPVPNAKDGAKDTAADGAKEESKAQDDGAESVHADDEKT